MLIARKIMPPDGEDIAGAKKTILAELLQDLCIDDFQAIQSKQPW